MTTPDDHTVIVDTSKAPPAKASPASAARQMQILEQGFGTPLFSVSAGRAPDRSRAALPAQFWRRPGPCAAAELALCRGHVLLSFTGSKTTYARMARALGGPDARIEGTWTAPTDPGQPPLARTAARRSGGRGAGTGRATALFIFKEINRAGRSSMRCCSADGRGQPDRGPPRMAFPRTCALPTAPRSEARDLWLPAAACDRFLMAIAVDATDDPQLRVPCPVDHARICTRDLKQMSQDLRDAS
ncbi:hypothetical protein DPM13_12440 [Paracoccus mutanolyticus]|uniref:Uncharacterized protein n=1 Tax=Paracoccus mutanolyticus TaxID=1499308 RepID=A0ABM6WSI8_9RHOB|nr:hypothetical protein DPM13_12440 [Paracoccus mutanolyticus]